MVKILTDDQIAGILNRNGFRTGRDNRWNRQRVEYFRLKRKIPECTAERKKEQGWMNLTEAADYLGISGRPIRNAVERGEIEAQHPIPEGPWIFQRKDLDTFKVRRLVMAMKNRRKTTAKLNLDEPSLFKSSTCLEGVYLQDYQMVAEARFGLGRYFAFYNYERLHQALGYRTPAEVYGIAAGPAVAFRDPFVPAALTG